MLSFRAVVRTNDSRSLRIARGQYALRRCGNVSRSMCCVYRSADHNVIRSPCGRSMQLAKSLLLKQQFTGRGEPLLLKPYYSKDINGQLKLLPGLQRCQLPAQEWYQLLSQLSAAHKNVSATIYLADWLLQTGSASAGRTIYCWKSCSNNRTSVYLPIYCNCGTMTQPEHREALRSRPSWSRPIWIPKILYQLPQLWL